MDMDMWFIVEVILPQSSQTHSVCLETILVCMKNEFHTAWNNNAVGSFFNLAFIFIHHMKAINASNQMSISGTLIIAYNFFQWLHIEKSTNQ